MKAVRSKCWGCKRFRLQAITPPIPGQLPKDRTTVGTAFEIIGVDFAGPMRYRKSSKAEGKAYLAIFACSLTRAVHLELLRNLETGTFIICLKRFIARRGRPRVVYSDNGGTFVKASKWLEQIRKDEKLRGLGLGLVYNEDDIEMPVLTPALFLHQRTSQLPEEEPWRIEERDLKRRAKYLLECKNNLWCRWKKEYMVALRERHNMAHKKSKFQPEAVDVVLLKSENKNRGAWPLGIVEEIYPGKDNVVRAVQVKTPTGS